MAFDFYEAAEDMTPAEVHLCVSATAGGVCNAVAFWFELQLDATTSLSTSPYADKARMHQPRNNQSMPGCPLSAIAQHDHTPQSKDAGGSCGHRTAMYAA